MEARPGRKPSLWWNLVLVTLTLLSCALVLSHGLRAVPGVRTMQGVFTLLVFGTMLIRDWRRGYLKCTPSELYARVRRGDRPPSTTLEMAAVTAAVVAGIQGLP